MEMETDMSLSRRVVVQKAYTVFSASLLAALGVTSLFFQRDLKRLTTKAAVALFFTAAGAGIASLAFLICCPARILTRRSQSLNWIGLGVLIVAWGTAIGLQASWHKFYIAILAIGVATLAFFVLTVVIALQNKLDLSTTLPGIVLVGCVIFVAFGVFMIFLPNVFLVVQLVYTSVATLTFAVAGILIVQRLAP